MLYYRPSKTVDGAYRVVLVEDGIEIDAMQRVFLTEAEAKEFIENNQF